MTKKEADKIKKILRKENAVFTSTAGYYDSGKEELRVKVAQFLERSYSDFLTANTQTAQREAETRKNIIKVLRALETNGTRPAYRLERNETTNAYGAWDCRYVIFK